MGENGQSEGIASEANVGTVFESFKDEESVKEEVALEQVRESNPEEPDDSEETNEEEAETEGAEPEEDVDEEGGEDEVEPFAPVVDTEDSTFNSNELLKADMRSKQLEAQGVPKDIASYVAKVEAQNLQYKHAGKTDSDATLETIAGILNLSVDDFKASAENWAQDVAIEQRLSLPEFQDMDEAVARRIISAELKAEMSEKNAAQTKLREDAQAKFNADLEKLYAVYPEARDMQELPPEIIADFKAGLTPLEAFQRYKLNERAAGGQEGARDKARADAAKAGKKSPGSARSKKESEDGSAEAIIMQAMKM